MAVVPLLRDQAGTEYGTAPDGRQGSVDPTGGLWVQTQDGGMELLPEAKWRPAKRGRSSKTHFENLVDVLDSAEIARLGDEVHRGVTADVASRREYMEMTAEAIRMLGLRIDPPRSDAGGSGAPLEGMSTVRHPLLLEACLKFQADFVGEMLPAGGPVKVRNDATTATLPPEIVQFVMQQLVAAGVVAAEAVPAALASLQQTQAAPPESADPRAQDLETDFNHFLTTTATEYYPDTDRASFITGLMGCTFKKVSNCPLRERPTSESVSAKDLIVDAGVTDLANAPRVTHEITYLPHEIMQLQQAGVFADVVLGQPIVVTDEVQRAIAETQGYDLSVRRPEDRPHVVWETACWLHTSLDPEREDGTRLPRPYKLTQDRDTRKVVALRRNWAVEDKTARKPRREWVKYPFVPALGFYDIGLMHILGNSTMALTAAWRLNLDAMMFSNFPGFLYADVLGKQLTNIFRVPPGGGVPIQTGGGRLADMVMPMPYKGPQPTGLELVDNIAQTAGRVGTSANLPTGEGQQNVPVGTVLATLQENTKLVGAVFKRQHAAQAEEFGLLKERFREDPEAFWRHNPKPARRWQKAEFLSALNDADLVPAADPNTPSKMHRVMTALAVFGFAQAAPMLFKLRDTAEWLLRSIGAPVDLLDTEENIQQKQAAQAQAGVKPTDPAGQQVAMLKAQAAMAQAQAKGKEVDAQVGLIGAQTQKTGAEAGAVGSEQALRAHEALVESQDRAADRKAKMAIDMTREQTERMRLEHERQQQATDRAHDVGMAQLGHAHDAEQAGLDRAGQAMQGLGANDG